jgi:hypothetical protein
MEYLSSLCDDDEEDDASPLLLTTINFFSLLIFSAINRVRWRTFKAKTSCVKRNIFECMDKGWSD